MVRHRRPAEDFRRTYEQTYTAFLTYNLSKAARLRLEGSRHLYGDGRNASEVFLQWTVLWGAHSHREPDAGHVGHDH